MQLLWIAFFSLISSAVGTALTLLIAWFVSGSILVTDTAFLLVSIAGAAAGSFIGWQIFSRSVEFDAMDRMPWNSADQQSDMPRPLA